MWYKNIAGRFFGLVTKHACDRQTDGWTDRQNYDSQDRASIAASRGKKYLNTRQPCADLIFNVCRTSENERRVDKMGHCKFFILGTATHRAANRPTSLYVYRTMS